MEDRTRHMTDRYGREMDSHDGLMLARYLESGQKQEDAKFFAAMEVEFGIHFY